MDLGAANVVALMLFISFAIDRITTGLMFVLSFMPFWPKYVHDSTSESGTKNGTDSEKLYRVFYFVIATFLAIIAMMYVNMKVILMSDSTPPPSHIGVLIALGMKKIDWAVDSVVTALVLVASSDFLGRLIEKSGAYDKTEVQSQTIQVTGELNLVRPPNSDASEKVSETHS